MNPISESMIIDQPQNRVSRVSSDDMKVVIDLLQEIKNTDSNKQIKGSILTESEKMEISNLEAVVSYTQQVIKSLSPKTPPLHVTNISSSPKRTSFEVMDSFSHQLNESDKKAREHKDEISNGFKAAFKLYNLKPSEENLLNASSLASVLTAKFNDTTASAELTLYKEISKGFEAACKLCNLQPIEENFLSASSLASVLKVKFNNSTAFGTLACLAAEKGHKSFARQIIDTQLDSPGLIKIAQDRLNPPSKPSPLVRNATN